MSANLKVKNDRHPAFAKELRTNALVNDPAYLGGQTTFRGSRVLASTLFEYLAEGKTIDDFLKDFPTDRKRVVELLLDIQGLLQGLFKVGGSQ